MTLKDRVKKLEQEIPQPLRIELDDGQVVVMDNAFDLLCKTLDAMRNGDNGWLNSQEAHAIINAKHGQHSMIDLVKVLIEAYQDKRSWE